jgi:chromosome condensin MukBEF ATPase and DNA-binding subunit MukB
MSQPNRANTQLFTQLDAGLNAPQEVPSPVLFSNSPIQLMQAQTQILQEMLKALDRNNELLEELVTHVSANQKQRNAELGQWKQANPTLSRNCRVAAEALNRVHTEYLKDITAEIADNAENMVDGEFMFNEFIDRFGPRLAHLNGVLQVLSHLGSNPNPNNAQSI